MILPPVVSTLSERLGLFPSVERVILFGSRARGDARWSSDIDLAVSCPQAGRDEWTKIWNEVDEAPTLLDLDLVRLEDASPGLREVIRNEGKVLYERPERSASVGKL